MTAKKIYSNFISLLGAPQAQVEITEEHAKVALEDAKKAFQLYGAFCTKPDAVEAIESIWVEKYAYASLKETLGHIRTKMSTTLPIAGVRADSEPLLRTGWNEKQDLKNLILF